MTLIHLCIWHNTGLYIHTRLFELWLILYFYKTKDFLVFSYARIHSSPQCCAIMFHPFFLAIQWRERKERLYYSTGSSGKKCMSTKRAISPRHSTIVDYHVKCIAKLRGKCRNNNKKSYGDVQYCIMIKTNIYCLLWHWID